MSPRHTRPPSLVLPSCALLCSALPSCPPAWCHRTRHSSARAPWHTVRALQPPRARPCPDLRHTYTTNIHHKAAALPQRCLDDYTTTYARRHRLPLPRATLAPALACYAAISPHRGPTSPVSSSFGARGHRFWPLATLVQLNWPLYRTTSCDPYPSANVKENGRLGWRLQDY